MLTLNKSSDLPDSKSIIKVAVGGGAGVMLRFIILLMFDGIFVVPAAILIANTLGCFVLGLISGHPDWKTRHILLLGTGFAGGLTTFSNFAFDLFWLSGENGPVVTVVYLVLSISAGILSGMAGLKISKNRGHA